MPRRENTSPTAIYWLVDMRPETLVRGWPNGFPFYCGKTIHKVSIRLWQHRHAAEKKPQTKIARWLTACGPHVRITVVATIPAGGNWSAAERRWIEVIRSSFPGGANSNAGGQGTPGMVHTAETRAKISAAGRGLKRSAETRARIAAASTGRKRSPESIEKTMKHVRGRVLSPEVRAKISASHKARHPQCQHQISKRAAAKIRAANVLLRNSTSK